jgi:hypothetical protein
MRGGESGWGVTHHLSERANIQSKQVKSSQVNSKSSQVKSPLGEVEDAQLARDHLLPLERRDKGPNRAACVVLELRQADVRWPARIDRALAVVADGRCLDERAERM